MRNHATYLGNGVRAFIDEDGDVILYRTESPEEHLVLTTGGEDSALDNLLRWLIGVAEDEGVADDKLQ